MHFRLEFMLSRILEHLSLAKVLLRVIAVLCLVLGATGSVTAASASGQQRQGYSPGLSSNFAIADFDGDRRPDLATVEAQNGSASNIARYSIRLQLTAGAAQVFGLTAPAGGLQIVARDVNGDDALDVIVSTAWQHKQVAVLLNDGHGKFTLADPGAFPDALRDSQGECSGAITQIRDNAAILSSWSSAKVIGVRAGTFLARNDAELTRLSDFRFHTVQLDSGCSGRAPPFAVLHV